VFGDALQAAAVRVNDVNVDEVQALPAVLRRGKVALAIGGEGDPGAIGRPRRPEIAATAGSQRVSLARGDVQDPQVGRPCSACGDEDDLLFIGGKRRLIVVSGIVGQALQPRAVRVNAIDIGRAGALRREGDPIALGRPRWIVVQRAGCPQRMLSRAVRIRDLHSRSGRADARENDAVARPAKRRHTRDRQHGNKKTHSRHRSLRNLT